MIPQFIEASKTEGKVAIMKQFRRWVIQQIRVVVKKSRIGGVKLGERRNLVPCPYEVLAPIGGEEIAKSLAPLSPCSPHTAKPLLYHL